MLSRNGVYVKESQSQSLIYVCLYVDDLLIIESSMTEIEHFKNKLNFEMTDLGMLSYILGMEFVYRNQGINLHKRKYINKVLNRFSTDQCNGARVFVVGNLKLTKALEENAADSTLFKHIVGSLRFICNSRPDTSYAV